MTLELFTNIPVGTYEVAQDLILTTNDPSATIYYSINNGKVLEYTTSLELTEDSYIRAFASTDSDSTTVIEYDYKIVPPADTDLDGILDRVEGTDDTDGDGIPDLADTDSDNDGTLDSTEVGIDVSHPVDSDGDGTPDYKDSDSDDDGISDRVEGTEDSDSNGIPDYIDPVISPNLVIKFEGLTTTQSLVENIIYTVRLLVKSGNGTVSIVRSPSWILGIDEVGVDSGLPALEVVEGQIITFKLLCAAPRYSNSGTVTFIMTDGFSDEETIFTAGIEVVPHDTTYPLMGNRVIWSKNTAACFYKIYSQDPGEDEMSLLEIVPAAPTCMSDAQWYLERNTSALVKYAVSCLDEDGTEGECTLPKHAPSIKTAMCLLQGTVSSVGLTPLSGAPVFIKIKETGTVIGDTLVSRSSQMLETDYRGYFELQLPQGALVTLVSDDAGFKRDLLIPYKSAVDLGELLALQSTRKKT